MMMKSFFFFSDATLKKKTNKQTSRRKNSSYCFGDVAKVRIIMSHGQNGQDKICFKSLKDDMGIYKGTTIQNGSLGFWFAQERLLLGVNNFLRNDELRNPYRSEQQ